MIPRYGPLSLALVLLAVGLAAPLHGEPVRTITIDGQFADWRDVPAHKDPPHNEHDTSHNQAGDRPDHVEHADVDLLEYKFAHDADNLFAPHMLEAFVRGMRHRPEASALTCYFLAFRETPDIQRGRFLYAYRPTGGPHVLACLRNVYGDTCALIRTDCYRKVGGFPADFYQSHWEVDFCLRVKAAGWEVWYEPAMRVEHVIPRHRTTMRHLIRLNLGFGAAEPYLRALERRETPSWASRRAAVAEVGRELTAVVRRFPVGFVRYPEERPTWVLRLAHGLGSLAGAARYAVTGRAR